ncbi:MAG TPA: tetratricopeptide repeat protein [Thermoanaerobaculia bacterium]
MNQRLTRKEIKRDELATALGRSVDYAESHVRTILYAVGGVLLLLAIGVGVYFFLGARAKKANEALSYALRVDQAPIQAAGAKPDDKSEPSFATEAARDAKSKELFTALHDDFGGTEAGDVAALYLAQMAADEGQLDRARELWNEFVDDHGDHALAGEARLNLFALDRKQGKGEELVTRLRGLLEESEPPLPKDVLLHEMAVTQEQLGRPQEAVQAYQQIVDDYPQSPYRQDAQQKLSALDPSRPPGGGIGMPGMPGFPG